MRIPQLTTRFTDERPPYGAAFVVSALILASVEASSIAGVITAIATALIAVGGVITSVTVLIPILRGTREIHVMVNQQRTDALRYQERLTEALVAAGIPVPADSSLRAADGGPAG